MKRIYYRVTLPSRTCSLKSASTPVETSAPPSRVLALLPEKTASLILYYQFGKKQSFLKVSQGMLGSFEFFIMDYAKIKRNILHVIFGVFQGEP